MVGIINSKAKPKLKDNEKEKAADEETENKDYFREVDNNGKQSSKKRKFSSEKLFITDESDIKVKKKKKETADQNITDQQDERKKISKESEDKDNTYDTYNNEINTADNNGRPSFKKRKYSSEKLLVDESDIKVRKKKKDVNQSMTNEQNEKVSKEDFEDKDNEIDTVDNNDRQGIKNEKYVAEKSFVIDENDIKVKKKRKAVDQNITHQQNEKEKVQEKEGKDNIYNNEMDTADKNTYNNETDNGMLMTYDNDKQSLKKEKYALEKSFVANQSDVKIKKRRKESIDQIITDQQNEKEKMPKEKLEDKDNIYDNEIGTTDDSYNNDRQSIKKRKLAPEKSSCIKDERDIKIIGNSNLENQEIQNKNCDKIIEKKKRRLVIDDDTIITDDISEEAVKKEYQKPMTNSNKNKTIESEYLHEGDENNENNALSQTVSEKYSTRDFEIRNSDVKETSVDEKKKKKNRKKRNKVENNDICSKIGLQVMAKSDWKRLRNRYLDLQRYKMSQLKLHLRKAEVERGGIMTKNAWYYDKTEQNNMSHDKSNYSNDRKLIDEIKSCGRVNYAPGIIVKIEMDEPCTDLQSFKVH